MNEVKNTVDEGLALTYLAAYAAYLETDRERFVRRLLDNSFALNLPMLRYFRNMPEEEIFKLSLASNAQLLRSIRENRINEYIEVTRGNWVKNQLPGISREKISVEDIILANYARKKTFRELVLDYTKDPALIVNIFEDVDRFVMTMETAFFRTYMEMHEAELKDVHQQLQLQYQQLLEAQSMAKTGSFEWDLTGNKRSAYTPEVFKIFEFEQTSNLESFLNDVHAEDRQKIRSAIEVAMKTGTYECEYRYNRKNIPKILHSKGKMFFGSDGKPHKMVGTITDVTEKATLIQRLEESNRLSLQGQALTHTGSWKWQVEHDLIEWSDEMYNIYGLEAQSEKITFHRFLTFVHEEDRNRRISEITEALKTGVAKDYIMRIIAADGKEKILRGKGQVLTDNNGRHIGILGTCQDITNEHKLTAELQLKNAELRAKNRDLESFNFIASHDLQEPLRKIQIYSNRMIDEAHALPERFSDYTNRIYQASSRLQRMIADFLAFYQSLKADEDRQFTDLNGLLQEVVAEMKGHIESKKAMVEINVNAAAPVQKNRIRQLFRNLLSNSLKFSQTGVNPHIKITSEPGSLPDGRPCQNIMVTDNGIGFEEKYKDRIFDLFQKLHSHEQYPGTGIGLSLCKKIAEDHSGHITASSAVNKGACFTVSLPLTAG